MLVNIMRNCFDSYHANRILVWNGHLWKGSFVGKRTSTLEYLITEPFSCCVETFTLFDSILTQRHQCKDVYFFHYTSLVDLTQIAAMCENYFPLLTVVQPGSLSYRPLSSFISVIVVVEIASISLSLCPY